MARTDNDTWDLASSVGATATAVAAGRALASRGDGALIDDPFAEPLVAAVGVEFFTRMARGEVPNDAIDDDVMSVDKMRDGMAVRTRFFDEFFLDAAGAGIRQMVILASGLDSRAYRLAWPAGTTVYEIDQPQVIEFKTATLAGLGAEPRATRRAIAIDLRNDWPAALRDAGFDAAEPAAWIAEGLLGYLPPDAQDRLLDDITALSAPGSRFATQTVTNLDQIDETEIRERSRAIADKMRAHGLDLDMTDLFYFGDRKEAGDYMAEHGWTTATTDNREEYAKSGLSAPDEKSSMLGNMAHVVAKLG